MFEIRDECDRILVEECIVNMISVWPRGTHGASYYYNETCFCCFDNMRCFATVCYVIYFWVFVTEWNVY
jgi:hypothetical protein